MLTKPILFPINAFDATKTNTISFNVIGGDQVVANKLTIYDNNNHIIYENIQNTYTYTHTIEAGSLYNIYDDRLCSAVIKTKNSNDEWSENSNIEMFYCYATPHISWANKPNDDIITTSNYRFAIHYYAIVPLISYVVTLYDNNRIKLKTTDVVYTSSSDDVYDIYWDVDGLDDGSSYILEVVANTKGNMTTTLTESFSCSYSQPIVNTPIYLENDCNNGCVNVKSNLFSMDGKVEKWQNNTYIEDIDPTYIDNQYLDIAPDGTYHYSADWYKSNTPTGISNGITITGTIKCGEYFNYFTSMTHYEGKDIDLLHFIGWENDKVSIIDIELCNYNGWLSNDKLFSVSLSSSYGNYFSRISIKPQYLNNIMSLLTNPSVKLYFQFKFSPTDGVWFDYDFVIPPTENNFQTLDNTNMSFSNLDNLNLNWTEFDNGEWL